MPATALPAGSWGLGFRPRPLIEIRLSWDAAHSPLAATRDGHVPDPRPLARHA